MTSQGRPILVQVVANDAATGDDEFDVDRGERGDGDEIGLEAGLDAADALFPAEEARGVAGGGANRFDGCQSDGDERVEFFRVLAVGEHGAVGSEYEGDAELA